MCLRAFVLFLALAMKCKCGFVELTECNTSDDCASPLTCYKGQCVVSSENEAQVTQPEPPCRPYGRLNCAGKLLDRFDCSPPIHQTGTPALLKLNNWGFSYNVGTRVSCDGQYHGEWELIVALSTGWYNGGSRCGKNVRVRLPNSSKSVVAKVVDECDSQTGCDRRSTYQRPCGINVVDGSNGVLRALGILKSGAAAHDVIWEDVQ